MYSNFFSVSSLGVLLHTRLQAVWHISELQVHGWGQEAVELVVLWDNVTLHSSVRIQSLRVRFYLLFYMTSGLFSRF